MHRGVASLLAGLLPVTLNISEARGGFVNGEQLLSWCDSPSGTLVGECWGYLMGAVDAWGASSSIANVPGVEKTLHSEHQLGPAATNRSVIPQ